MLKWLTTSSLGTIKTGFVSELAVASTQTLAVSEIKYQLASGSLPQGLTLQHDGNIAGRVSYNTTGTYTFVVKAIDNVNTEQSTQTFSLTVTQPTTKKYTRVYLKPYLAVRKRQEFREFINDRDIFEQSLMYRYYDRNFGVQQELKLVLDFGLQQLNLVEYLYPLQENFYKKRMRLGKVKSAIAKNSSGQHIYDVVYVEIVDEFENNDGISVNPVIYNREEIYYPGSVANMRKQLRTTTLLDWTTISVDEDLQPRFMLTQQPNDFRVETYIKAVPLCYTLPNKSQIIVNRIKNSGFKFNTVDFEIDRIIVENSLDNSGAKYLLFNRDAVGDLLDIDGYLLGPEGWVRLDDENDQPLQRE